jgi:hypothetical protein
MAVASRVICVAGAARIRIELNATGTWRQRVRITFDGSTLTVKAIAQVSAPSDSDWTSQGAWFTSTACRTRGGMLGFRSVPDNGSTPVGSGKLLMYNADNRGPMFLKNQGKGA